MFNLPVKTLHVNPLSYDKRGVISCIEQNYHQYPSRNVRPSMGTLHHCYADFDNPNFAEPDWDSMRPVYAKVINEYLASMDLVSGCKFDFGIVNYSAYGDTISNMRSHFHTESDFSAVHYIQFDERVHTPTRFENPFKWGDYQNVMRPHLEKCVVNDLSNSWTCDWWELETHEDDIVFFPALLPHEVMAQKKSDKLRITIALNISIAV